MKQGKSKSVALLGVAAVMAAAAASGMPAASAEATEKSRVERRGSRGTNRASAPERFYGRTNAQWVGPHATVSAAMPAWERGIVLAAIGKRARKAAKRMSDAAGVVS